MFDLKKACKNCKKASIQKYKRDIERLAELINLDEIPKTGEWLKKPELHKKYRAIPLNKRRAYSVAAVKAVQSYGLTNEKWSKSMFDDVKLYKAKRSQQKLSPAEKEKIPEEGFSALKKISTEFKRTIKRDISREEVKGLYLYSQYIIIRFYSEFAFRNDLATVQLGEGDNRLVKSKGIYTIKMTDFKASEKIGAIDVKLSKALSTVLAKYIRYRAKFDLPHSFLLVNSTGGKLTKKGLGTVLNQITKKFLGKGFGTRIIRIMKARHESKTIDKAKKIAQDMLHTLEQNQQYNKK